MQHHLTDTKFMSQRPIPSLNVPSTFNVADETHMMALGAQVANHLPIGGVVLLHGNLGAGKTTLVRGLLRSLGFEGTVKSPTYTLVEPYTIANRDIYHFDLYRLADPEELEFLGVRDYFRQNALCLIEWPEKAGQFLPPADLNLFITHKKDTRDVTIK